MIPSAKIVCIFRHPAQRIFSLYRLKRAYGMIPWTLEQAIQRDPELLESGRYATHLRTWQCAFGAHQVMATLYEDLRKDPQSYIDCLADFIGIPRFVLTQPQVRCVHTSEGLTVPRNYYWTRSAAAVAEWLKARRLDGLVATVKKSPLIKLFLGGGAALEGLSPDLSFHLHEILKREVEELEALLNRDLSGWKSANAVPRAVPAAA